MARFDSTSRATAHRWPRGCWCRRRVRMRRTMADRPAEPAPRTSAAQWVGEPERGSAALLKVMIFVALRLGRPAARVCLYLIAAYFFAFAPAARRSSLEYLRRALGRAPQARDRFRQVFTF